MDKSRIKSFIILLLAVVNVCLLFIVLKNTSAELAVRESGNAALQQVLAKNGITLSEDVVLPKKIPTEITLSRSMLKEKRNLSSLIGSCTAQDLGGNIIYYHGSNGHANYRGTGEFEIMLDSAIIPLTDTPVASCYSLAKKLGIDYANIEPQLIQGDDSLMVTMVCAFDGTPVYNAAISFSYSFNRLFIISGMRPLDTEVSIRVYEDYPDGATVLMSFLDYISSTGGALSEITEVELGYFISSSVSGSCVLRPVWCIITDSGRYYINGQTGKPENLE